MLASFTSHPEASIPSLLRMLVPRAPSWLGALPVGGPDTSGCPMASKLLDFGAGGEKRSRGASSPSFRLHVGPSSSARGSSVVPELPGLGGRRGEGKAEPGQGLAAPRGRGVKTGGPGGFAGPGDPRGLGRETGWRLSAALWTRRRCLSLLRRGPRLPGLSPFRGPAGAALHRPGAMARPSSRDLPLVAVCQVTSTPDKEQTFAACSALVQEAAKLGACLAFLPEAFDFIARDPSETLQLSEPLGGDLVTRYARLARECGLWLSLGGFHERGKDWEQTQRIYNCHVLLDSTGSIVATYRKTHLCDVELPGQGSMCESTSTVPGPTLGSPVSTPAGKVGLAICYDLRFPELSLALAQNGAEILTYPSAFGSVTGPAHWEVLLRARAIETQCYVVAAAQWGQHHEKRGSYGHSMVVDPWGVVVARCSEGPGICLAHIDLAYLHKVRQHMPVAQHRRHDLYGNLGCPHP